MTQRSIHPSRNLQTVARSLGLGLAIASIMVLTNCGNDQQASRPVGTVEPGNEPDESLVVGSPGSGGAAPITPKNGGREALTPDQVKGILEAECTGWSREGEPIPATLQLVVDTSGSMTDSPPGDDQRSKWEITREALKNAVDALPASTNLGALFYPNKNVTSNGHTPGDVSACIKIDERIPIQPLGKEGSPQRQAFEEGLNSASIESYTATHDAYKYALEELLEPYESPNRFILLITDGAPTINLGCTWPGEEELKGGLWDGAGSYDGDTDPIIASIREAAQKGIRTFLIGAPGSEKSVESETDKRPWLSEAAIAGETASPGCTIEGPNYCHFDMTRETDFSFALNSALQSIRGQIIDRCTFALPEPPPGNVISTDLTQIIVEWGDGSSSLIQQDAEGDCVDGWQVATGADDEEATITLCQKTCDDVKADGRARIFFSFGCSPAEIDEIWK